MWRGVIRYIITLILSLCTAPLAAEAQPAGKVYRIGMLETRSTVLNAANIEAFRQGLLELGYKEGQNFEIVYRSSDGHDDRFPDLANELVGLRVDLILTRGTPAALAGGNEPREARTEKPRLPYGAGRIGRSDRGGEHTCGPEHE